MKRLMGCIGLVIRSVETDLGRCTPMVKVNIADAYLRLFLVALCYLIVEHRMEMFPNSFYGWCEYFQGDSVTSGTTDEFSMSVTKITSFFNLDVNLSLNHTLLKFLLYVTQT